MSRAEAMERHPSGKGIPESPEVAQARMDDEALTLANSRRRERGGDWAAACGMVLFGYLVLTGITAAVSLAEGWVW